MLMLNEIENSTDKNVDFEKQDIVINVDLRKDLNVRITYAF